MSRNSLRCRHTLPHADTVESVGAQARRGLPDSLADLIALPSLCGLEIRRAGYVAGLVRDHRAQVLRGESLQAFAIAGRLRSRNRQPRTNQASDQTKPVFSFRHATESW